MIDTLAELGVAAHRAPGRIGIWVGEGSGEAKIGALGVRVKRWVTLHGFALNVNTDLSYFDLIIACEGEPVTSMKVLLGHDVEMERVEDQIVIHFADVFAMTPEELLEHNAYY